MTAPDPAEATRAALVEAVASRLDNKFGPFAGYRYFASQIVDDCTRWLADLAARLTAAEREREEAKAEAVEIARASKRANDHYIGALEADRDAAHAEIVRLRARIAELEGALSGILPGKLCGESWGLPDDERMPIQTTVCALKVARGALARPVCDPLPAGGDDHAR